MAECLTIGPFDGRDTLAPLGEAYVAFVRANPALYRLMFGEGFPAVSQYSQAMRDLRKRSYDVMKSNLEKRLSEAELPIAGLFLWALVHGLALLLIDGQVVPAEDGQNLVRRVLQLAGTGLDEAQA
jgi:hypothetical protein